MSITTASNTYLLTTGISGKGQWHDLPLDMMDVITEKFIEMVKEGQWASKGKHIGCLWYESLEETLIFETLTQYFFSEITDEIDAVGPENCLHSLIMEDKWEEARDYNQSFPGWNYIDEEEVLELAWLASHAMTCEEWGCHTSLLSVIQGLSEELGITFYDNTEDILVMDPQVPLFRLPNNPYCETFHAVNEDKTYFIGKSWYGLADYRCDLNPDEFDLYISKTTDRAFAMGKKDLSNVAIRLA